MALQLRTQEEGLKATFEQTQQIKKVLDCYKPKTRKIVLRRGTQRVNLSTKLKLEDALNEESAMGDS